MKGYPLSSIVPPLFFADLLCANVSFGGELAHAT